VRTEDLGLDVLIEEITAGARGEEEQLHAFREAVTEHLPVLSGATVVGEEVAVVDVEIDRSPSRRLVAVCRRQGRNYAIALTDVRFPPFSPLAPLVAAYARWNRERAGLLSMLGRRSRRGWAYPLRTWPDGRAARRLLEACRARPLRLHLVGIWEPAEHDWGEPGAPIAPELRPLIIAGPRPQCQLERASPLAEDGGGGDLIALAQGLVREDRRQEARGLLRALIEQEPRCLEAHVLLGNLSFRRSPRTALAHYQTAVAIAELALPRGFNGVLGWSCVDNRPFLRGLHGMGLCWWRLGHLNEAAAVFDTLLWLDPEDSQGELCNLRNVRARMPWRPTSG
jgi:tetratricopeptide (TPR) repeat protein